MRARFTDPASFELERSISYFVEHAPASATAFADSIDATVARLVENPYSSQETEMPGIRRAYIRRFRTRSFTLLKVMRLSFFTSNMPPGVGHGRGSDDV
jgi:plasmid stabilization system protein ParE